MSKEYIVRKLNRLVAAYTSGGYVVPEGDLMGKPVYLSAYEMAALFLDIEKDFSVDLNELVPQIDVFSPNRIAQKLMDLCE